MLFLNLLLLITPVNADTMTDFDNYMNIWDEYIELASQYLKDAEFEFKNGEELQGCVKQRQAAKYGIKATESLIKAFEINGSTEDMSSLDSGLAKWRELSDFC